MPEIRKTVKLRRRIRLLAGLVALGSIAGPAAAQRIEERFGDWRFIKDVREARYCWIETTATRTRLPQRQTFLRSDPSKLALVMTASGLPAGYYFDAMEVIPAAEAVHLGIGETWWLSQRSEAYHGFGFTLYLATFGGFPDLESFVDRIREADSLVFAAGGAFDPLDDAAASRVLPIRLEFSLDGFQAAEAAILSRCAGPDGWSGRRDFPG